MRLCRALGLFFGSCLTWRTSWRIGKSEPRYHTVARDGFLYVEPRIGQQ
jgi:hypothetical protein